MDQITLPCSLRMKAKPAKTLNYSGNLLITAVHQGDALSRFMVEATYLNGVKKDDKKAFEWFKKAADQGFATAQFFLGKMYVEGQGTERDNPKAFKWFQRAADQGHIDAQFFLGKLYAEGRGVKQDEAKAIDWLTQAAEQRYPVEKANRTPEAKSYSEAFRKLLQSFQSKAEMPFDANVKRLSSFKDAVPLLENLPSDALVIFDMDDTLIA